MIVVSIELNNIRDDTPKNSIHSNYTVTDKADGYSMLLIKFGSDDTDDDDLLNKMFMIDQNLRVFDTGILSNKEGTYLFNGEYLEYDKTKSNRLNKYGIFDFYINNGSDICELPLMSEDQDVETRLGLAHKFINDDYIRCKLTRLLVFSLRNLILFQQVKIFIAVPTKFGKIMKHE